MPYCSSCGNELHGDAKFCAECGQSVLEPVGGAAAVGAAPGPVPVQPVAAYAPPPAPSVQPMGAYSPPPPLPPPPPFPGARRRSLTWLWIGGAAAVVVIAVVCVLVFVVFKGGDDKQTADISTTITAGTTMVTQPAGSTGTTAGTDQTAQVSTTATAPTSGDDAQAAEKVVRQLLTAMENQDVQLLFSLMDPAVLGALPEGEARDAALAAVKAELATLGKMKFSGIEMTVEITSPTTATVTLTAGKATITDANGQTTTEDIKDSATPGTMDLSKQDGKWYIASSFFQ